MGIRLKLGLTLLLFGFVVLAAMLWSNQFVLHKTMLQYVDQRDQQRLQRLKNNIEFFLENQPTAEVNELPEHVWKRLLKFSHRIDLRETSIPMEVITRDKTHKRKRHFPADEFESRVTLMSTTGQVIHGFSLEPRSMWLPIEIEAQPVAIIGYHPLRELIEQTDIEFAANQFKLLSLGAVFITLLALFIIWPIANHLLAPIRQLTQAMQQLTSGNLSHRLTVSRKDEFGALQRDVNQLAKTLEAAQTSRNQWIADISHELRTPLTVLNGSIEAMRDGIRPLNQENLDNLHQEVALLQRLIEDLYQLSLSDLGALQYHMQTLDLSQVLLHSAAQFENRAKQKGLQLKITKLQKKAWINADETRLQQLLNNLLQNAIDYTDSLQADGSAGQIQLSLAWQTDNWLLCIEDSAPTVKEAELEKLQERFYRAEGSRNRRTGGTGLGLAMVSQVVQAHAGELHISQSDLCGLKVCVVLPAAKT